MIYEAIDLLNIKNTTNYHIKAKTGDFCSIKLYFGSINMNMKMKTYQISVYYWNISRWKKA